MLIKIFNRLNGSFQEFSIPLTESSPLQQWTVGRSPTCNIPFTSNPEISRHHGTIEVADGALYFTDVGSTGGTTINDNEVSPQVPMRLKIGDIIDVGECSLVITEDTTDTASSALLSSLSMPSWTGDLWVECRQIYAETSNTKTFSLVPLSPVQLNYKPGQFTTIEAVIDGTPVRRSYSLSSSPTRSHKLEITVKRVPTPENHASAPPGMVSNWLHDRFKVGDKLKLIGSPTGNFTCLSSLDRPLIFISAGSGITPFISMLRWILDTAENSNVIFINSVRNPEDIIFRQELEWMAARMPNLVVVQTATKIQPGMPWSGYRGRISPAMLQMIAPDLNERTAYVCGPDAFMAHVKQTLESIGFPMAQYRQESFGVDSKVKSKISAAAIESTGLTTSAGFVRNGKALESDPVAQASVYVASHETEITWNGRSTILEMLESKAVPVQSACRAGVCGMCKVRKIQGTVQYHQNPHGLNDAEKATHILCCVAHPVDRVIVEVSL